MAAPVYHHSKPPADLDVDEALVRSLLRTQHPDLAELPLQPVDSGWDNAMYRLGEHLAVRLPRRLAVAKLIEHELRWLPDLAAMLPIAVPTPVRAGVPSDRYPVPWSVVAWLHGRNADVCEPRPDQAEPLAAFLCALHRPAPADAPANPHRGVPLRHRAGQIEERIRRLGEQGLDLGNDVIRIYEDALDAPIDAESTWLHGDLHAGNMLVNDVGTITGVIDWGDMARGDRATDLATLWMNLGDRKARENAMRACHGVSDATWRRAKGWAFFYVVTLGTSGLAGDARHAQMARRTRDRLVDGP